MADLRETLASPRCVECDRSANVDEQGWCLRFADLGEVVIYCPECAEREFDGDDLTSSQRR